MNVRAMESSLVKDNPLLLPLNKKKTVYDGFITVQVRYCVSGVFFIGETTFLRTTFKNVNLMIPRYRQFYMRSIIIKDISRMCASRC